MTEGVITAGQTTAEPAEPAGLVVSDVSARYDRHAVLHQVSLTVRSGEFACLLGANGAGKTTLLNCISGLHRTWDGDIHLGHTALGGLRGYEVAKRGVCYVPEGRGVFPDLTVMHNLRISIGKRKEALDVFFEHFPRLAEFPQRLAGSLSGGEQQMLAMAPAVVGDYHLLLLDELSLGLAPRVVDLLFGVLEVIRRRGVAILMVEQFAERALALSDTAYVMRKGSIVYGGPADRLQGQDARLRALYMGSGRRGQGENAANHARVGDVK
ncbi:MAG: ABC transporter ATP-binding protein [Frankia sp.]